MNLKKYSVYCLVLILLISLNVYGELNLSQSSMLSSRPAVAVNQNGVKLVVWTDSGTIDDAGAIWYNVYKNGVWEGAKDAGLTREISWASQLDVDSKGNFHLAFADGYGSTTRDVFHSVYNPDSGWSAPKMIWKSPSNSAWQKIDVEEDMIYITWYHKNTDPWQGSDIVMQIKGIEDVAWPDAYFRITYTANLVSIHPAFKVKDGKAYACNMGKTSPSAAWGLFYKEGLMDSSWQSFKAEQIVSPIYYPELEVDDDGNVHIIFSNKTGNYFYKSKIGDTWKGTEIISNKFARLQFGDIEYKNNLLVATWLQTIDGETFVYYSRKMLEGDWEMPIQVSDRGEARVPKLWMDDNGYAHFVWIDKSHSHERDVFYEEIPIPVPLPFLQLSDDSLSFTVEGDFPEPATLTVKNIGEDSLTYNISTDQSWMTVTPTNGTLDYQDEVEIQVEITDPLLDVGTYTGIIEVSSPQAINSPRQVEVELEVLVPPIFPPLNFTGEVKENRALFIREYIHHLSWEPNPDNRNITKYKLYEVDGDTRIFLQEFSSSTFEYMRRNMDKDRTYTYELYAVDDRDRMGVNPAVLVIE